MPGPLSAQSSDAAYAHQLTANPEDTSRIESLFETYQAAEDDAQPPLQCTHTRAYDPLDEDSIAPAAVTRTAPRRKEGARTPQSQQQQPVRCCPRPAGRRRACACTGAAAVRHPPRRKEGARTPQSQQQQPVRRLHLGESGTSLGSSTSISHNPYASGGPITPVLHATTSYGSGGAAAGLRRDGSPGARPHSPGTPHAHDPYSLSGVMLGDGTSPHGRSSGGGAAHALALSHGTSIDSQSPLTFNFNAAQESTGEDVVVMRAGRSPLAHGPHASSHSLPRSPYCSPRTGTPTAAMRNYSGTDPALTIDVGEISDSNITVSVRQVSRHTRSPTQGPPASLQPPFTVSPAPDEVPADFQGGAMYAPGAPPQSGLYYYPQGNGQHQHQQHQQHHQHHQQQHHQPGVSYYPSMPMGGADGSGAGFGQGMHGVPAGAGGGYGYGGYAPPPSVSHMMAMGAGGSGGGGNFAGPPEMWGQGPPPPRNGNGHPQPLPPHQHHQQPYVHPHGRDFIPPRALHHNHLNHHQQQQQQQNLTPHPYQSPTPRSSGSRQGGGGGGTGGSRVRSQPASTPTSTTKRGGKNTPSPKVGDGAAAPLLADRTQPITCFVVVKGKHQGCRYATSIPIGSIPEGSTVLVEGDRGEDIGTLVRYLSLEQMAADCRELSRLEQEAAAARVVAATEALDVDGTGPPRSPPSTPRAAHGSTALATGEEHTLGGVADEALRLRHWPWLLRVATSAEQQAMQQLRADEGAVLGSAASIVEHFVDSSFRRRGNPKKGAAGEDGEQEHEHENEQGNEAEHGAEEGSEEGHRDDGAAAIKIVDCEYQLNRRKLTLYVSRPSRDVFVDFRRMQRKLYRTFRCRIWMAYMDEVFEDGDAPENAVPIPVKGANGDADMEQES